MLSRYNAYSKKPREKQDQGYHYEKGLPRVAGICDYMASKVGYWRPWKDRYI